jgi:Domain of unknown function (DUF4150)
MAVTIKVNGACNSLVHKMSNGISTATIPDVCKTPSPGGPVPVPYPNIAQSITLTGGTTSVKGDKMMAANKGSKFALSNGDNAGVAGGVKSSTFMKEATWILYSFDVKLQKKNACRFSDKMFHNSENAANLGGLQQPLVNQRPETLDEEMAEAEELGVKPIRPEGKKFAQVANEGPIKWAITAENGLQVIPKVVEGVEISHAVISGGAPVLAAGEASVAVSGSTVIGLEITGWSGHFMFGATAAETAAVVALGRTAFEAFKIIFP